MSVFFVYCMTIIFGKSNIKVFLLDFKTSCLEGIIYFSRHNGSILILVSTWVVFLPDCASGNESLKHCLETTTDLFVKHCELALLFTHSKLAPKIILSCASCFVCLFAQLMEPLPLDKELQYSLNNSITIIKEQNFDLSSPC